jgi:hypothetical protein
MLPGASSFSFLATLCQVLPAMPAQTQALFTSLLSFFFFFFFATAACWTPPALGHFLQSTASL